MRKEFYKYLTNLFKKNDKLCILLGDIGVFSFRDSFKHDPNRIYNLGIMEQTMIGVACGLSKSGFVPFVHSIAPFITERCYEQLKLNLGYENVNCFLVSVGNSYDYSSLGCTHHCPNDLNIVSSIPNFKTFCPGNSNDVKKIISSTITEPSPKYIRLSETENNLASIKSNYEDLEILKLDKRGICIVVGNAIHDFKLLLDANINSTIIYTYNVSNFDINKLNIIIESNKIFKKITLVEPCYDSGILSQIATSQKNIESLKSISIPKIFIEKYGKKDNIDKHLKLDDASIIESLKAVYNNN
jgi:transketolase